MHTINYRGQYFSVDGPLNLSRSVQGRPVLYTAGASPAFVEMAATYTDGAFIPGSSLEQALHIANALRTKLTEKNRAPENFIVATAQNPIVAKTDAEAQQKYLEQVSLNRYRAMPAPLFFGSAERVANQVQQWYEAGAMDMLIVNQDYPTGLADFAELVVPILQERGIFHTEYEADTLRGNLELPRPKFRKI
ncbi:LLM class flavin-dependent oxidoreductase [Chryseobacterium sp. Leaf405]|uniref:LLM class flavin-dependent oxidoreductase n=1 Tax=Chryseobacterium sp. Leaf405 TaxID=1736367 RepID=UPI000ADA2BFE|nr:LLM class flavin-dependent oxidoreductase [Chryseobacterium sp. Leaf405]